MSLRIGFGLTAMLGALAASVPASAQECSTDADCPKAWACTVTGSSGCAGAAPACDPGADGVCPEPEPVKCDTTEYKSCVPGPCEADTDCDEGMVCVKDTYESCSGGGSVGSPPCDKEEGCPEPAPAPEPAEPECTTEEHSACLPRYLAPCEAASDCGEGFDCVAQQECACSGGTSTDPGFGGGADPGSSGAEEGAADGGAARDADCTCTDTDVKYCQVKEVECQDAGDCPTDWTCEDYTKDSDVACAVPEPAEPADGGAADAKDTGCVIEETTPVESVSYCVPPFADLGFGFGRDLEAAANGATGGGTAKGETQDDGAEDPTAEQSGAEEPTSTEEKSSSCSVGRVGGESSNGSLVLLALGLGLALSRTRRRAQR